MTSVTQLTVVIPNAPGNLAKMTDLLRAAHVNISALSMMETGQQCKVHLILDDVETAKITLKMSYAVTAKEVLAFHIRNAPGAIASIGRACAGAGVNIQTLYSTATGKEAMVYVVVDDLGKAKEAVARWKKTSGADFSLEGK